MEARKSIIWRERLVALLGLYTHKSIETVVAFRKLGAGFDQDFFARGEGGVGIFASDRISGRDVGICMFWYFNDHVFVFHIQRSYVMANQRVC